MLSTWRAQDVWIVRVVRCAAAWMMAGAICLGFDIVMEGTGLAADDVPHDGAEPAWSSLSWAVNALITIATGAGIVGLVAGSILPKRLDRSRLALPMPARGERLRTPPNVWTHMLRRTAVGVPAATAATVAVLTGLLSVTTDIQQDDSPSTLGAIGGFWFGTIIGFALAIVAAPVIGTTAAGLVDDERPRRRTVAITATVAAAVALIPLLILLDATPDEAPGIVAVVTTAAAALACIALAAWTVR